MYIVATEKGNTSCVLHYYFLKCAFKLTVLIVYFRDFVFNSSEKRQHLASDKTKIKYLYGNLLILFSHELYCNYTNTFMLTGLQSVYVCACICALSTGLWNRKFGIHICTNYIAIAITMYSNLCEIF